MVNSQSMSQTAISFDGVPIAFETCGQGETAILFVHGWQGNRRWWDHQRDAFSKKYQIVQMDLAGHGESLPPRKTASVRAYAEDIRAVVEKLGLRRVVLVGHSMSGSNVVEAYNLIPTRVPMVILVDTLLDLDHLPSLEEVSPFLESMRKDFRGTIEASFAQFVFAKTSPKGVIDRIVREIGTAIPSVAISNLEPFYSTDIREACERIKVPVRAINSDLFQTNPSANRKYFINFEYEIISGVGHYPMLEAPTEFNKALGRILESISA